VTVIAPAPREADISFAATRGKQSEVALADDGQLHVGNLRAMAMPPISVVYFG
jgi:hypothetical protein